MLVLSRKPKDGVRIGEDITVTVLSVEGDRVRLGIDAPSSVRILRAETLQKAAEENRLAAGTSMNLMQLFRQLEEKPLATCVPPKQ